MQPSSNKFGLKTGNINPQKGTILIAEPFLQGYHFSRSIVLLTEHTHQGSMGFVLNKPLNLDLGSLDIESIILAEKIKRIGISSGGPVNSERLFYIHRYSQVANSLQIDDFTFFAGNIDELFEQIETDINPEENVRFFVGYSGWSPGQLKDEIEENAWLIAKADLGFIFQNNTEKLWDEMIKQLGGKFLDWLTFPNNPAMN